MAQNISGRVVISEGIRQNFTIKPNTTNSDNAEKAVNNAEMRKRRDVCNIYQSFKNNFEMQQKENEASARAHAAKVQQNTKKPLWQRKKP